MMKSILVVDDDADLAEMMVMLLKSAGLRVKNINTGSLFFDTVDTFVPDIILMDIYLGEHDGRHLCRELKDSDKGSVPVILYSAGHITNASISESLADAFISKPFEIDNMLEKIRYFTK